MSDMNQIEIRCNPSNPVNYLACCGIFDLLSRMDASALAYWETQPPVRFVLRTSLSEHDLVDSLTHTLCTPAHWDFNTPRGTDHVTRIVAVFCSPARSAFRVGLDWWVETLHQDGSIGEKSAWKMYAGQQTVSGIIRDMVAACAGFDRGRASEQRLSHLLDYSVNMTGRFGFDPRSSRNALDVGYSPNDLQMPIATYPFAELLAVFGAASFFPQRLGEAGSLESTRGWSIGPPAAFVYGLWVDPLPIPLARIAASHSSSPRDVRLFSERAHRKNYSNLTLAKPTTIEGGTP